MIVLTKELWLLDQYIFETSFKNEQLCMCLETRNMHIYTS